MVGSNKQNLHDIRQAYESIKKLCYECDDDCKGCEVGKAREDITRLERNMMHEDWQKSLMRCEREVMNMCTPTYHIANNCQICGQPTANENSYICEDCKDKLKKVIGIIK